MEFGTVIFFDNRESKEYGFIIPDNGGKAWFHFGDGRRPQVVGSNIIWRFLPDGIRYPRRGTRLAFKLIEAQRGPKACPWTYESLYRAAEIAVDSNKLYRVMVQHQAEGEEETFEEWYGLLRDQELETVWPLDYDGSFSCKDFTCHRWFEVLEPDGWVECSDPRLIL